MDVFGVDVTTIGQEEKSACQRGRKSMVQVRPERQKAFEEAGAEGV